MNTPWWNWQDPNRDRSIQHQTVLCLRDMQATIKVNQRSFQERRWQYCFDRHTGQAWQIEQHGSHKFYTQLPGLNSQRWHSLTDVIALEIPVVIWLKQEVDTIAHTVANGFQFGRLIAEDNSYFWQVYHRTPRARGFPERCWLPISSKLIHGWLPLPEA
ncbi:MAG: hypothetical protein F6K19_38380 [Cyanothece sp. SIO1E1]|nr:hypothetical protein [Cyanothece sp. SIO1E1]